VSIMNLPDFLLKSPHWLSGGKGQGIILSSRVRLARNLADTPFPAHAAAANKKKAARKITDALSKLDSPPKIIPLEPLDESERGYLLEKRLISTQMLKNGKFGAVALWRNRAISAMINEEDHLRLQAIEPGIMIEKAFQEVWDVDQEIRRHLSIASNQELGYLTSCPTNLGTGMRVSLFCHLPGMAMSGKIEETLGAMVPSGIAVRGFFGESSAFLGNIFQISNQITLGLNEKNIVSRVQSICDALIERELDARKELKANSELQLMDRVCRSYGILSNVRTLGFPEFVGLLSSIRLGVDLKWIKGLTHRRANRLMMETQPAHLDQMAGRDLLEPEMDFQRAEVVRNAFRKIELLIK
jgi:protein arginine kinase